MVVAAIVIEAVVGSCGGAAVLSLVVAVVAEQWQKSEKCVCAAGGRW